MSKHSPFAPFRQAPPQPPIVGVDRFGKVIEQGHLVLFHAGEDLVFEVTSIGPVLNPAAQGGRVMQVHLKCDVPVQFQAAHPNRGLVIVGETQARIQARAGSNGQPDTPKNPDPEQPMGPALVLTDPPAEPAEPTGTCGTCGGEGTLGEQCTDCGCSTYQPPAAPEI